MPGLIHRPAALQQVQLNDAEPGRTYSGTYCPGMSVLMENSSEELEYAINIY